jgi:hypothetical protein
MAAMPEKQTAAASLEHRSLLSHPPGFRPFRGTDLFERIGGQPTIDRLIDSSGSWIGASCADPGARDIYGRTPLDWLEQAAPSVPRAAVRDLLAPEQRR